MMRTPLLRFENRTYRAQQRARAFKFALLTGFVILSFVSIGALAAQSPIGVLVVYSGAALLGLGIHSLTRPMP